VFYQQATEFLSRKMPTKEDTYGVMFMMDEFPTLGKMDQFHAGIAYFRGYKVRLFLIIQDTEQLKGIYEEHGMNSFLSNSTYRITFAANNIETANLISQLIGNKTVEQEAVNKPKFLDLNPASRSLHISEVQRALLLPQEVINLPRDEQILLIESSPPIRSKKIFYFKDRMFTRRLLPPIEVPQQEPYDPRKRQVPKPPPPGVEDIEKQKETQKASETAKKKKRKWWQLGGGKPAQIENKQAKDKPADKQPQKQVTDKAEPALEQEAFEAIEDKKDQA
jgi:type IV secretion system protein VirD4